MAGRALDDQGRELKDGEDDLTDAPPFSIFQLEYLRSAFKAPELKVPATVDEQVALGSAFSRRTGQLDVITLVAKLTRGLKDDQE